MFWLFLYTPIPWVVIVMIVLYRHDLLQLAHPFKDSWSINDWRSTLEDLHILIKSSQNSSGPAERSKIGALLQGVGREISEKFPNARFYILIAGFSAGASVVSSSIFVPLFEAQSGLKPTYVMFVLALLQLLSAFPLILAVRRYSGAFPSRPFKYHLDQTRTGSLVRYLDSV